MKVARPLIIRHGNVMIEVNRKIALQIIVSQNLVSREKLQEVEHGDNCFIGWQHNESKKEIHIDSS